MKILQSNRYMKNTISQKNLLGIFYFKWLPVNLKIIQISTVSFWLISRDSHSSIEMSCVYKES